MFALVVSPQNARVVVAGTGAGNVYRSPDAGVTWAPVARGLGRGVTALAYDPLDPAVVLAGTRGGGIWASRDGGLTWAQERGPAVSAVRTFGFSKSQFFAGTSAGVQARPAAGGAWATAGLPDVSVDALAVAAVNDPVKVLAGGDIAQQDGLPLYLSVDGGVKWNPLRSPSSSSSFVSSLAAGPVIESKGVRPVVMGTNSGAFLSTDNGQTWSTLAVPSTDVTAAAFVQDHPDRFYVASDGGGSDRGGLWVTGDQGATFQDLKPPLPVITSLGVSAGAQPMIYAASFRTMDHAVMLWSYQDAGGPPQAPAAGVPSAPASAPAASAPTGVGAVQAGLTAAEVPYLVSGILALFVLFLALFAYLARGRPRRA